MQAVIGRIQLRRMKDWIAARNANALAIRKALLPFTGEGGVVRLPELGCLDCPTLTGDSCSCVHAYYKYYAFVRPENLADGWSRDQLVEEINACGVPCYTGSCSEVYLEKAFENTSFRPKERLPVARELGETALMFLVHPTLTPDEIHKTCQVIHEVLEKH